MLAKGVNVSSPLRKAPRSARISSHFTIHRKGPRSMSRYVQIGGIQCELLAIATSPQRRLCWGYAPCAGIRSGVALNLDPVKKFTGKKKLKENHLSPSRRRASRSFFLQVSMQCNRPSSSSGLWASAADQPFHRVQSFAEECSGIALWTLERHSGAPCRSPRFRWVKN